MVSFSVTSSGINIKEDYMDFFLGNDEDNSDLIADDEEDDFRPRFQQ